jgi:hypothetical protein
MTEHTKEPWVMPTLMRLRQGSQMEVTEIKYTISARTALGQTMAIINASCYAEAAEKWVRLNYGRGVVARRVTGTHDKSGCFQGYKSAGSGETSFGEQFHVS